MLIGITGTDRGLGKSIADYLALNYTVERYGKSFDVRDYSVRQKIINSEIDCLISVAKPDFVQTQFVYEWFEAHGTNKRLISIGSAIVKFDTWGDDVHMMRYHTQKCSLAHAVKQINHPNFSIINPGHLYYPGEHDYDFLAEWCKENILL